MTKEDSADRLCELCEAEFEPRSIIVRIDPYGHEICDACTRAVLQRANRAGVKAQWPTWEAYRQALREHPEPMMTERELQRAEELGFYDAFSGLAQLF